jgi:hypothetical protein
MPCKPTYWLVVIVCLQVRSAVVCSAFLACTHLDKSIGRTLNDRLITKVSIGRRYSLMWACILLILKVILAMACICEPRNLHPDLTGNQTQNLLNESLMSCPETTNSSSSLPWEPQILPQFLLYVICICYKMAEIFKPPSCVGFRGLVCYRVHMKRLVSSCITHRCCKWDQRMIIYDERGGSCSSVF